MERVKWLKRALKSAADSFRTRSFRVGGYSVAATAMVIALAVAVNLLVRALPANLTQFDTTAGQIFTISEQTENVAQGLGEDVTIYWLVRSGNEDDYIGTLLERYSALSGHIRVVKRDPDVDPSFIEEYTDAFTENSLVVASESRSRYVDYYEIFVLDYENYYYYGVTDWSFDGESAVTIAIDYVVSGQLPVIYLLTGHGEPGLPEASAAAVERANYDLQELSLLTQEAVPDDAACVLIYDPQRDISESEQAMLQTYLDNSGRLFLISDPLAEEDRPNLEALMAGYGIRAVEGMVVEGSQSHFVWGTPYYLLPELQSHTITQPLIEGGYQVLLPVAQGLQIDEDLSDLLSVSSLLTTSSSAYAKSMEDGMATYEKEDGDVTGPFSLAALATLTLDDGIDSEVLWVSSIALLDEQTNEMISGGNQDFFLNALGYLCQEDGGAIAIHAKSLATEYLTIDNASASVLTVLMVGALPLLYLAVGIGIWLRRKRR